MSVDAIAIPTGTVFMHPPVSLPLTRRRCPLRATAAVWGSVIAAVVFFGAVAHGEPEAILTLPAGQLAGRVIGAAAGVDGGAPTIRWQSPTFADPFDFPIGGVARISFPALG